MENLIIILLVTAVVGLVVWYLYRKKKKGAHCIGCPYADHCGDGCTDKKEEDA